MEKAFEFIVNSYLFFPQKRKLDYLDNLLFSLLLQKEDCLLKKPNARGVRELEEILNRYYDYRNMIYKKMLIFNPGKESKLIKDIYIPPDRLVFLLTHSCQLRCKYCRVRKFSASMDKSVLFKGMIYFDFEC